MSSLPPEAEIIGRKISERYSRNVSLGVGISELELLVSALLGCGLGKEPHFVDLSFLLRGNGSKSACPLQRDSTAHIH